MKLYVLALALLFSSLGHALHDDDIVTIKNFDDEFHIRFGAAKQSPTLKALIDDARPGNLTIKLYVDFSDWIFKLLIDTEKMSQDDRIKASRELIAANPESRIVLGVMQAAYYLKLPLLVDAALEAYGKDLFNMVDDTQESFATFLRHFIHPVPKSLQRRLIDNHLKHIGRAREELVATFKHETTPHQIAFSKDGCWLATATPTFHGAIRLYRLDASRKTCTQVALAPSFATKIYFSEDSQSLITHVVKTELDLETFDQATLLWKLDVSSPLRKPKLLNVNDDVEDDIRIPLSGTRGVWKAVRLHDRRYALCDPKDKRNDEPFCFFDPKTKYECIVVSPGGEWIACADVKQLRLLKAPDPRRIDTLEAALALSLLVDEPDREISGYLEAALATSRYAHNLKFGWSRRVPDARVVDDPPCLEEIRTYKRAILLNGSEVAVATEPAHEFTNWLGVMRLPAEWFIEAVIAEVLSGHSNPRFNQLLLASMNILKVLNVSAWPQALHQKLLTFDETPRLDLIHLHLVSFVFNRRIVFYDVDPVLKRFVEVQGPGGVIDEGNTETTMHVARIARPGLKGWHYDGLKIRSRGEGALNPVDALNPAPAAPVAVQSWMNQFLACFSFGLCN